MKSVGRITWTERVAKKLKETTEKFEKVVLVLVENGNSSSR